MDLRCESKKHGELIDGVFEVKCKSRWCGGGPRVVVIHRWDVKTGEALKDKRFKEPRRTDATYDRPVAVRDSGHPSDSVHDSSRNRVWHADR